MGPSEAVRDHPAGVASVLVEETVMARQPKYDAKQSEARARREAHFARGGTVAMWRGSASVFKDRRADLIEEHMRQVDRAIEAEQYDEY